MIRPLAAPVLATAGGAAVVTGSFLPWLSSGERNRSSYQLFELVRRIEVLDSLWARAATFFWPVVPLLAAVAVVTAWWDRRVLAGAFGTLSATYVALVCWFAWNAPLPSQSGVAVSFCGAVAFACSGAFWWSQRHP